MSCVLSTMILNNSELIVTPHLKCDVFFEKSCAHEESIQNQFQEQIYSDYHYQRYTNGHYVCFDEESDNDRHVQAVLIIELVEGEEDPSSKETKDKSVQTPDNEGTLRDEEYSRAEIENIVPHQEMGDNANTGSQPSRTTGKVSVRPRSTPDITLTTPEGLCGLLEPGIPMPLGGYSAISSRRYSLDNLLSDKTQTSSEEESSSKITVTALISSRGKKSTEIRGECEKQTEEQSHAESSRRRFLDVSPSEEIQNFQSADDIIAEETRKFPLSTYVPRREKPAYYRGDPNFRFSSQDPVMQNILPPPQEEGQRWPCTLGIDRSRELGFYCVRGHYHCNIAGVAQIAGNRWHEKLIFLEVSRRDSEDLMNATHGLIKSPVTPPKKIAMKINWYFRYHLIKKLEAEHDMPLPLEFDGSEDEMDARLFDQQIEELKQRSDYRRISDLAYVCRAELTFRSFKSSISRLFSEGIEPNSVVKVTTFCTALLSSLVIRDRKMYCNVYHWSTIFITYYLSVWIDKQTGLDYAVGKRETPSPMNQLKLWWNYKERPRWCICPNRNNPLYEDED